jgi:predicted MPP superfamily phosphohydrolase
MIFGFIAIIVILLGYAFFRGYKNTKAVTVNAVEINKPSFDNNASPLKVLHISDMHIENISVSPEELKSRLQDESIDIIALTGDFLDRKRSIPRLIPYLETLTELNPKYGTYAVYGNHDYVLRKKNFRVLNNLLQDYGIKTMQNEHHSIVCSGKNINIIGIDDNSTNRSEVDKAYSGIKNGYNLVLTHDPNVVLKMKDYNFDYLLSGHFHGGQIYWPKPYHLVKMGKLARMNIVKGLHYYQGKAFYISEGLGQTGVNVRIGSRPEITIHYLYVSSDDKQESVTIAG